MKPLPARPNIDYLKRQAKDLLSAVRRGDIHAIQRLKAALPSASSLRSDQTDRIRLHDAQSCIAREYGFTSWISLRHFVEMSRARASDRAKLEADFANAAYAGDITGGMNRSRPERAASYLQLLAERGPLDRWIMCACGNVDAVAEILRNDPEWIERPEGPLALPPLVAATHSGFGQLPKYRDGIRDVVDLLLEAGVDPNQSVGRRWPPASPAQPSAEHRLSALYGSAGVNHDAKITQALLDAGADPNDGESLYHALEAPDTAILEQLLQAGVRVEGTNALYRALDFDNINLFRTLLSYAIPLDDQLLGQLLIWAIKRRRSVAHAKELLDAGANPNTISKDGTSAQLMALRRGLQDVAVLLRSSGAQDSLSDADLFLAACAAGDDESAFRLRAKNPDFPINLDEARLKLLPELAATGSGAAVMTMVRLGWPIDVRGGDWDASALNQSVFRGDAKMTEFLLANGASWTEQHGYGDNVCGTLNWASLNEPTEDGDWLECARALVAHGMPGAMRDPSNPNCVLVDKVQRQFSDDVTAYLLSVGELRRSD